MFKISHTWGNPSSSQSGFPSPGAGAQTTGAPLHNRPDEIPWAALFPTQGAQTFDAAGSPVGGQQGYPAPLAPNQRRPKGSMPNKPVAYGLPIMVFTPEYDRGAAAYVPNYGKLLTNPIGAGVVALYTPQPSYGPAAQYADGSIWWTSQAIPTTIAPQSLTDPQELGALLGDLYVQGVVRTTG